MKFIATLLLLVLLFVACAAALVFLPSGPSTETFVDIAPGTSTEAIATQLEASGIIRTRYAFDLLRAYQGISGHSGTLKAGEYRFDHPASVKDIYARLLRGDVYTRTLTIPEGFNIFDIAQAIEAAGLGSGANFLAAARQHVELIAAYRPEGSAPPASLEGYLFPDTYHFSRHTTPTQMLTAMVHRFGQALTQLQATGDTPTDIPRTVLMASLVEKEVSQDSERPLVAGVFTNRLAQGMPLATDPTVIYAALLEGRWRGTIYASDLQNPSTYNTYRHPGLPPGPICNPGMAALRAAIHPAQTDYLYFVADAAGHSRFSAGLKEHAAQVQTYRNSLKFPHPTPKAGR
ncbi:endolytic transglycosylase MltG [Granulicella sp. dw_53]|uniref:endolytic transglycosylase MltG n=1 Tax=Granulicella sp. dw_53 TaxID=2719792 RepID=UPI001BD44862|nr:endolytic transglycosylase MltG [Granulicella sp. dw_53]